MESSDSSQCFTKANLIEQLSGYWAYILNKEDKPLTTEERKQLHEHRFS